MLVYKESTNKKLHDHMASNLYPTHTSLSFLSDQQSTGDRLCLIVGTTVLLLNFTAIHTVIPTSDLYVEGWSWIRWIHCIQLPVRNRCNWSLVRWINHWTPGTDLFTILDHQRGHSLPLNTKEYYLFSGGPEILWVARMYQNAVCSFYLHAVLHCVTRLL